MAKFEHRFDWNADKAKTNLSKHGVSFELASTVLLDPLSRTIYDADHSDAEDRWVTLGRARNGELIVIVHTWQDYGPDAARIRIIWARFPR